MKRLLLFSACFALLFTLAGCGDSEGGDTNNEEEPIEIGELDAEKFLEMRSATSRRASCETAFGDCPNRIDGFFVAQGSTNVDECIAGLDTSHIAESPRLEAIEAGRMVFDEDAARACLTEMIKEQREDACNTVLWLDFPECDEVFVGTVENGEDCVYAGSCESGFCDMSDSDPGNPDECHGECAPGLEEVGKGEACDAPDVKCDRSQRLYCGIDSDNPDDYVCVAYDSRDEGDACALSGGCKDGMQCRDGVCTVVDLGGEGDDCTARTRGTVGLPDKPCEPGLVCGDLDANNNGTCQALLDEGDACDDTDVCKIGLFCNPDTTTCEPVKSEGEPCEYDDECGSYLMCDTFADDPVCEPVPVADTCEMPRGEDDEGASGDGGSGSGGL